MNGATASFLTGTSNVTTATGTQNLLLVAGVNANSGFYSEAKIPKHNSSGAQIQGIADHALDDSVIEFVSTDGELPRVYIPKNIWYISKSAFANQSAVEIYMENPEGWQVYDDTNNYESIHFEEMTPAEIGTYFTSTLPNSYNVRVETTPPPFDWADYPDNVPNRVGLSYGTQTLRNITGSYVMEMTENVSGKYNVAPARGTVGIYEGFSAFDGAIMLAAGSKIYFPESIQVINSYAFPGQNSLTVDDFIFEDESAEWLVYLNNNLDPLEALVMDVPAQKAKFLHYIINEPDYMFVKNV